MSLLAFTLNKENLAGVKLVEKKVDVLKKGKRVKTYKSYTPAGNSFNNLKNLNFSLTQL